MGLKATLYILLVPTSIIGTELYPLKADSYDGLLQDKVNLLGHRIVERCLRQHPAVVPC